MIFEAFMEVFTMFNMNNKKVKQRISAAIIVLLVIAMIVPTITSIFLLIQLRMEQ